MKSTVSILGTVYKIEQRNEKDDEQLKGLGGYCDVYKHLIVIRRDWENTPEISMLKEILRHEIVHAFFHECGLWDNSNESKAWATNEEMTDWFAIQGPKVIKAWEEADAL